MSISTPLLKDITKIKKKAIGNFTKRQIIIFFLAGLVGVPLFFLTLPALGSSAALMIMVTVMMPFFIIAVYEKKGEGLHAEELIKRKIKFMYGQKKKRPYKVENRETRKKEILRIRKEILELERKGKGIKAGPGAAQNKKPDKKIGSGASSMDKKKTGRVLRKLDGGGKQTSQGIKKAVKPAP